MEKANCFKTCLCFYDRSTGTAKAADITTVLFTGRIAAVGLQPSGGCCNNTTDVKKQLQSERRMRKLIGRQ